jgi:hypothetical protein
VSSSRSIRFATEFNKTWVGDGKRLRGYFQKMLEKVWTEISMRNAYALIMKLDLSLRVPKLDNQ